MENFEFLQSRMDLTNEELKECLGDLKDIEKFINQNNIKFESNYKLGFYSHMVGFLQRIKKREHLENVDDGIKDSIDEYSLKISEQLISLITNKYDFEPNYGEVILAAIHIQTAISMEKEGLMNG
ncbi:PRD domain-containing protein [Wukongibacter sp. M2B1]|uniref:PRD domain-containing protein n=1 Tax=Wukongibacter sp. M2B1 TaxID=3088895 RepID=UPI003D79A33D